MNLNLFRKSFVVVKRICNVRYLYTSKSNLNFTVVNFNEKKENDALEYTSEDLSTVTPYFPQSFNLAAYVNSSETLQNLVHLNVNLSKIEKNPIIVEKILKLNFEQDIKKGLLFIKDFVNGDDIGNFLTKNPLILCEDVEDLEVRVNYLKSKQFEHNEISRIITKNPFWLMFSTIRIDRRLGFYQEKFELSGNEVRLLATKQPRLITYNLQHIQTNFFVIKEEMGFKDDEIKQLLLAKSRLWMMNQKKILERFNYIHNVIKIPHEIILQCPHILLHRNFKVKQRHTFLEKLGRAQYNPTIENFVPLNALFELTDIEFCKKYAKCHVDDFNMFLKTL
ncbi:transcription termination factor 3, mitochondrial [Papilio machaon]|uniref:transcription termination factor 3, mitochondrial n=1 Tax=Papilio machaon TaxID=76193 RepID=UPI001E6643BB|nr:transcription termination factor 3, mitochondrial [Papilio machaon]